MTLSEYLRDVYSEVRLDAAPEYLRGLAITVQMFEAWYWEKNRRRPPIRELRERDILRFARSLRDQGRSPVTCNNKIDHLLILWRSACKTQHCKRWPHPVQKFRVPRRIREGWNAEDLGIMVAHALTLPTESGWSGRHWAALFLVSWDTAHRIGALLQLRRSHYDPVHRILTAPADVLKQLAEHRSLLHPQTCDLLDTLPPTEMLFPWPWSHNYLQRKMRRRILDPCGLSEKAARCKLMHGMRRGSVQAVYLVHGPQAAADHAGHADLQMLKNYVDPRERQVKDRLDAIPRPDVS